MLSPFGRFFTGTLLFATLQCHATALDFDRFNGFCTHKPLERTLLLDAADGNLDDSSLLRAALILAGHHEVWVSRLESEFQASAARCRNAVLAAPEDRVTEAIFRHLRSDFLYGEYRPDLFDAGRTITQGEFNCLTATILFQAFCREFSLDAEALWEPAHVRCWVGLGGGDMGAVVETTASSVAKAIGPRTTLQGLTGRLLTETELLGKVLYNRGVTALVDEQYAVALSATWSSCLLDQQHQPAWSNLRACLNNWALGALESGRVDLARQLLEEGMRLDPTYEPFQRNWALLIND